jgi:hypothetical protein
MKTFKIIISLFFTLCILSFTGKSKSESESAIIKKFFNNDGVTRKFQNLTPKEEEVIMKYIEKLPPFPTPKPNDVYYKPETVLATGELFPPAPNVPRFNIEPPIKDNKFRIHTIIIREQVQNIALVYQDIENGNLFRVISGDPSTAGSGRLNFLSLGYSCRITKLQAARPNVSASINYISIVYQECNIDSPPNDIDMGFNDGFFEAGQRPLGAVGVIEVNLPDPMNNCFFGLRATGFGVTINGISIRYIPCN